ncbi:class III signal peptide-containing protein [bacterium]|nr:class III signal peptide-containing protein [bacterium]
MNKRKRQKGQGLLEYLLIVAVVVVAVVGFAVAFDAGTDIAKTTMTDSINSVTGGTP